MWCFRVLVTAVLADRNPAELHMFRTYRKHLKTPHRDDRDVKLVEVPDPESKSRTERRSPQKKTNIKVKDKKIMMQVI